MSPEPAVHTCDFLNTEQLAAEISVAKQTIRKWRSKGIGPAWIKLGNGRNSRCVYRRADVEVWLRRCTHGPDAGGR